MKGVFGQLWSYTRLPNWVAFTLLCLIASVPIQQSFTNTDTVFIEQLEHNDSETEQETEKEIKKIDGDEFLMEYMTICCEFQLTIPQTKQNRIAWNRDYRNIFDPPPECSAAI
jgi:hypothetical protein